MKTVKNFIFGILTLIMVANPINVMGQTYRILGQWNFEDENWMKPDQGASLLQTRAQYNTSSSSGLHGRYLELREEDHDRLRFIIPQGISDLTVEMWVRFPANMGNSNAAWWVWGQSQVHSALTPTEWFFNAKYYLNQSKGDPSQLRIPLNGTERTSPGYFYDGRWHQVVWVLRADEHSLWLDGEQIGKKDFRAGSGFSLTPPNADSFTLDFAYDSRTERAWIGDIDEITIYSGKVPEDLIREKYRDAVALPNVAPREETSRHLAIEKDEELDPKDYPPGHPTPSLSPYEQLSSFPLPRYKSGHELFPLVSWFNPVYLAGGNLPNEQRAAVLKEHRALQFELANGWHYHLSLFNITRYPDLNRLRDRENPAWATIEMANQHPEFPLAITTFWAQVKHPVGTTPDNRPYILTDHLPQNYYFRSGNGHYLNQRGESQSTPWMISPTAPSPSDLFQQDGLAQRQAIEKVTSHLTRPVNYVSENGEVPPYYPIGEPILTADPYARAAFRESRFDDWAKYQAYRKTQFRTTYWKTFANLEALSDARISWYGVDAGPDDRFDWSEARLIQTPMRGQYYSTPDFYPRWPSNWATVRGPWRGWSWIEHCRKEEIQSGDLLFAPFVAAGWSQDPTQNIRPAQWLGLLKHMVVLGAEYFHPGFFITTGEPTKLPLPANYVWQLAIPSYAQAIGSHAQDILLNGDLIRDDEGVPIISYPTNNPTRLITVRKSLASPRYLISANINPNSNYKGNVPDQADVRVTIEGQTYQFKARRQGSVYLLDLSIPQSPVWYQLDAWHEATHPWWWSQEIQIDAALADTLIHVKRYTERPYGALIGDYRQFRTYLRAEQKGGQALYTITQRQATRCNLRVLVRSKAAGRSGYGLHLDGTYLRRERFRIDAEWRWVSLGELNLPSGTHEICLTWENENMELAKIELTGKY